MKVSILTHNELREEMIEAIRAAMQPNDTSELGMSAYTFAACRVLQDLVPNRFLLLVDMQSQRYPYFAALDTYTGTTVDIARTDTTQYLARDFRHVTEREAYALADVYSVAGVAYEFDMQ